MALGWPWEAPGRTRGHPRDSSAPLQLQMHPACKKLHTSVINGITQLMDGINRLISGLAVIGYLLRIKTYWYIIKSHWLSRPPRTCRTSKNFQGLRRTSKDFQGLQPPRLPGTSGTSKTSKDFQPLPRTSMDFQSLSGTSQLNSQLILNKLRTNTDNNGSNK